MSCDILLYYLRRTAVTFCLQEVMRCAKTGKPKAPDISLYEQKNKWHSKQNLRHFDITKGFIRWKEDVCCWLFFKVILGLKSTVNGVLRGDLILRALNFNDFRKKENQRRRTESLMRAKRKVTCPRISLIFGTKKTSLNKTLQGLSK